VIDFSSFSDELQKIAADTGPTKPINKELFIQFLKNTGAIAAGTGLGYGAGSLARNALSRYAGPRSSSWRKPLAIGLPIAGGMAAMLYKSVLDKKKNELLDEAYQRGLKERSAK